MNQKSPSDLDALRQDIAYLVERQRRMDDLLSDLTAELMPIARIVMDDMGERLEGLESKGYIAFGRELVRVVDRIVASYSPDDVRALGDNVVTILDTVKSVTQPDVMQIVHEATNAIHEGDVEEHGLFGMLRATRDQDVRRGLGVVLGVLRHVGKAADRAVVNSASDVTRAVAQRRPGLARALAPRRRVAASNPPPERLTHAATTPTAAAARPAAPPQAKGPSGEIAGLALDGEGFLADASQWTKDFALAMAEAVGVSLSDAHWHIVEHARAVYLDTGKAANIRALAKGAGVSTRDLYQLFPRAPGKTIARCAGTPKPAGCL